MYQNTIWICISWYSIICWFPVKKILMSAELKGCVKWFIYFLDFLWVRYKWVKFNHCRICVTDLREGGPFWPPHPWEALKKPILNRVKEIVDFKSLIMENTLKKPNVWRVKKQRRIKNPSEHQRWSFFVNILNGLLRWSLFRGGSRTDGVLCDNS